MELDKDSFSTLVAEMKTALDKYNLQKVNYTFSFTREDCNDAETFNVIFKIKKNK